MFKTPVVGSARGIKETQGRRAFTLIEVLVVVAIIALLIAILLPSLAKAREQGRSAQCLSNQRQIGLAINMYTTANKSYLPGPAHMLIFRNMAAYRNATPHGESYYKQNIPSYIAKYLGDRGRSAESLDNVAECPTFDRTTRAEPSPTDPWYYRLTAHYIVNTGGFTANPSWVGKDAGNPPPRPWYATKPVNYFGHLNIGGSLDFLTGDAYTIAAPKPIDRIKNFSGEWATADLWYAKAGTAGGGRGTGGGAARLVGTWPNEWQNSASSVFTGEGESKIPTYPYHLTVTSYKNDPRGNYPGDSSPQLTNGRTNAVYMDGHGETLAQWKGTNNPCMNKDLSGSPNTCR